MLNRLKVIHDKLSSNNPNIDFSELLTLIENDQKLIDTLPNIITNPIDDISSIYGAASQLHDVIEWLAIVNELEGEYPTTELEEIAHRK